MASALLLTAGASHASTVVFFESFTGTTIIYNSIPCLGGWYDSQAVFEQWYGLSMEEVAISNGVLQAIPTSSTRFGGIILSPDLMAGPGTYTLAFDLAGYEGDSNDTAIVGIWTGSGYDLTETTANALILNTETGILGTLGTATANQEVSLSMTTTGSYSLDFAYDGTSAVALFFGARTGGYPFPTAEYDNIVLSIPEPSAIAVSALA